MSVTAILACDGLVAALRVAGVIAQISYRLKARALSAAPLSPPRIVSWLTRARADRARLPARVRHARHAPSRVRRRGSLTACLRIR